MTPKIFTLCEYANNHDGQLSIFNTLDNIIVDRFPWRAYVGIAVKMKIGEEYADKVFRLSIEKDDTHEVLFVADSIKVDRGCSTVVVAGNLKGLLFNSEGKYIYKLSVDETIVAVDEFHVIQRQ